VPSCCPLFADAAEAHFDHKTAVRDLRRYRQKGPGVTTRLLRDGIAAAGPVNGLLLDIGAGVGALAFELMELGISRAVLVDVSSAYLAAASEEAARRSRAEAIQVVHADFLSVVSQLPVAAVVTLDRVICCYPNHERLLEESLRHAHDCFALSYPRDVWYVRIAAALENSLRRVRGSSFRTFVHSASRMELAITNAGFALTRRRRTWTWSVDVFVKADQT
jgi:SAM-dependent methyltransferase